ncbi:Pyruvate dehydrogenase E1 component subunit beta [Phycisphaerae bacterium RAS1]|nr:Pyruvate dehydrogenase E1 component subunit beta [Phycisphaerae bacterium RAS1]
MAAPAFTMNRAEVVDRNFVQFCQQAAQTCHARARRPLDEPVGADTPDITGRVLSELFESQVLSRRLDLMARELRKSNRGFYTIGSSGHEGNAVLGRALRFSDPAFLHYRAGALMAERSRQIGADFIRDTLLSFMASTLDPISGGRHKVWGSAPLCVLPQTSTIASQLPKSVGAALALERCKRLNVSPIVGAHGEIPRDSIMLCTFGDATVNHSVSQGAFNMCSYAAYQNLPVPLLLVCEDNGIGISVHTATNWIESSCAQRPAIRYFRCNGLDLVDALRTARQAAAYVRGMRKPAFLHMKVVRLLGHAGTDPETEYHPLEQIEAAEAQDPLLHSARLLLDGGFMDADDVLALYEDTRQRVAAEAARIGDAPKLTSAVEVTAPLAPYHADRVHAEATRVSAEDARVHAFALDSTPGFSKLGERPRLPEFQPPRHLAQILNWGLRDLLAKYPEMMIFGEDVAARGGVYYVTAGLSARFGLARVFNTLLDETSILGMAIGAGHLGLLPAPEIQYLAYVHNAIDQLRGEACSTQFFSNAQFSNPMVVRIQGLGYQKGFGGHFHNDNSLAALRDIPGLVIAVPSRGDDAVKMLRTCLALAKVDGRVVCFIEPIALYMTKDLHTADDRGWLSAYPPPNEAIRLGDGAVYHEEADGLTIMTYGNGLYMSLRAARMLRDQHGVAARVVDLRWLNPLNEDFILEQARATGRLLVVDEGRYTGGIAEAILALVAERAAEDVLAARLTGLDTYTPLGPAANAVLPTEPDIVREALDLARAETSNARVGRRPAKPEWQNGT